MPQTQSMASINLTLADLKVAASTQIFEKLIQNLSTSIGAGTNRSKSDNKSTNTPDCIHITAFESPWIGIIRDEYSLGTKAGRIALTPFAVAADIVLSPLIFI